MRHHLHLTTTAYASTNTPPCDGIDAPDRRFDTHSRTSSLQPSRPLAGTEEPASTRPFGLFLRFDSRHSINLGMDAGGLAQMSYNNYPPNGAIGLPAAGFASRGKGAQLKRLSVASPPKVASISEHQTDGDSTPRTSRSHLLAGLRTAPKTPAAPASAPYNQTQHQHGLGASRFAGQNNAGYAQGIPHTALGATFPAAAQQFPANAGQHMYSLPEQVLAPPPVQFSGQEDEHMDPNVVAQLVATEMYLAQRQQQLQQQLMNLTAQSMQGMSLNGNAGMRQSQQFPQTPVTPSMSFYNSQLQNGVSPIPQEVPGQPGLYLVYNPMTGQYSYVVDPNAQQLLNPPPPATPNYSRSTSDPDVPTFRTEAFPPVENNRASLGSRSTTPPKNSPSPPQDVQPLPPPSANAFRRGHKKASSLAFKSFDANAPVGDGPKSAFTRPVGFPQTPMTGTFGPGQGRAGEHPVRQPRGPPPLEELVASPTTKHEGSKNFATRQRRRAVHNLVRAGISRRVVSTGSGGSGTPVSENEITFPPSSDNDSDSVRSGSGSSGLSRKASDGSLRAAANGAIGSERKASKERASDRSSGDSCFSAASASGDEGVNPGSELMKPVAGERRKAPMLVLTSAEKRKSSMF